MIDFDTFTKIAGDLAKLIIAKGFKKLPKLQYIAHSGHTVCYAQWCAAFHSPLTLARTTEKVPVGPRSIFHRWPIV